MSLDPLFMFALVDFVHRLPFGNIKRKLSFAFLWFTFRGVPLHTTQGDLLEQCKENIVLGHRSREHMRERISPLKDIVNVFFNGQLVP